MLVYTTKIPVSDELGFDQFVEYIFVWLKGSKHYHFTDESWNRNAFQELSPNENESLQIAFYKQINICAVRFRFKDKKGFIWKTDYILNKQENKLSFQMYTEQNEKNNDKQQRIKLPVFLKKIEKFYGKDGDLEIKDLPIPVNESNAILLRDIVLNKVEYELPIIYITRDKFNTFKINPHQLAKEFKGQAHVFYDESLDVQNILKKQTNGKNPYLGAIEIYYKKAIERIYPIQLIRAKSDDERIDLIYSILINQLIRVSIDDKYSWNELKNQRQIENIDELKKKLHEIDDYKALATEYDQALDLIRDENRELKETNRVQEAKINSLNERLSNVSQEPVLIKGDEEDLYEDEQKAILAEILTVALKNLPKDHKRTRDILESVIDKNKPKCDIEQKRSDLRNYISKSSKWNQQDKNELKKYGLSIKSDSNHTKLVFYDDERYTYSASKTPSDNRGRKNLAKNLIHIFYGVNNNKDK